MDARFLGLDNILSTLGITSSSTFQVFYNSALEGRETTGLNITGCEWAPSQLDFSINALEMSGRIKAMATYVDLNSEPVARGKNVEISKIEGTIPRQKRKIVRGENDYRKELIALQNVEAMARLRGDSPYGSVRQYLAENLFETMAEFPDSHNASLSYARGQMFGKRELVLTDDNNPGGLLNVSFKSQVPAANVSKDTWYTVDADNNVTYVESTDPILTLAKQIRGLKNDPYGGYQNAVVEMTANTFYTLLEHPKVVQRIGYGGDWKLEIISKSDKADAAAQQIGREKLLTNGDEFARNWFQTAIGASELIIDTTVVGVDKLNANTKRFDTQKISAFPDGVVLVRPSGIIAQIFNVTPLRPDGQAIVAGIFGGRGIIEYFYDARNRTQTWISELTVLPVPTRPKDMYYHEVQGTTSVTPPSGI